MWLWTSSFTSESPCLTCESGQSISPRRWDEARPVTPPRLAATVAAVGVYGQVPETIWIPGSRYISLSLLFQIACFPKCPSIQNKQRECPLSPQIAEQSPSDRGSVPDSDLLFGLHTHTHTHTLSRGWVYYTHTHTLSLSLPPPQPQRLGLLLFVLRKCNKVSRLGDNLAFELTMYDACGSLSGLL